ncbi:hypothetical protein CEXT_429971 [Caerostris extrusa]|uniref:Uncharacterized protein n=1 Tax=Caerostris extrusa TaxID=172846 RepID=A0AAV4RW00_CAEEX|nr:hypothetical protein CEXT_429971 [Caerostris extrusa]
MKRIYALGVILPMHTKMASDACRDTVSETAGGEALMFKNGVELTGRVNGDVAETTLKLSENKIQMKE